MRFDGRSVPVTGAGKGTGRASARLLAARGAAIVAPGRASAGFGAEPGCRTVAADLADNASHCAFGGVPDAPARVMTVGSGVPGPSSRISRLTP